MPLGLDQPRRTHGSFRSRRKAHRHCALVRSLRRWRRIQCRARTQTLLRLGHRGRHGVRRRSRRPLAAGSGLSRRRRPIAHPLGRARRRRPRRPQRPQFHRARFRRARRSRLLRTRPRRPLAGKKQAQEVNRSIAPHVDVMLGNEEDFSAALGYEVPGMDEHHSAFEVAGFQQMIAKVVKDYPFQVVATTLRKGQTATLSDWGALCYYDGKFYQAKNRENLEIFDRVGGGDSFASGLIYGFLAGQDPQWSVECGAPPGALAMTTPGDTSMVTLQEVVQVMKGVGARIAR